MPDLVAIQAFECAARHASFTHAGRELDPTQSAISRQVKDLEGHLGALLFERIRQRVVLSEDGNMRKVRRAVRQNQSLRTDCR